MNTAQTAPSSTGLKRPTFRALSLAASLLLLTIVLAGYAYFSSVTADATPDTLPATPAPSQDAVIERLDRLEAMVQTLATQVSTSVAAQAAIAADVTTLRLRSDAAAEAAAAAASAAEARRAAAQQQRQRRVSRRTSTPAPAKLAVLSVDTWGGKPSVVIRDDAGKVNFLTLGDRLPGGGVIGAVQVAEQRITVRNPDGSTATLVGKAQ